MDRLSSCYFCGDALDASLDEYPVVPSELDPPGDVQRTVVLCGGCRRKLDSVLETVVEASKGTGNRDGIAESPPDTSRGGGDEVTPVESSLDEGEELLESVGEADSDGSPAGDTDGSGASDASAEADADAGVSTDADADADAGASDGSDTTADADGGSVEAETSLTRLEYNRVMRLLQNREFPVKRRGFVNVAANAYEITTAECEEILDVAIDHGLVEEEDGKLVKPED